MRSTLRPGPLSWRRDLPVRPRWQAVCLAAVVASLVVAKVPGIGPWSSAVAALSAAAVLRRARQRREQSSEVVWVGVEAAVWCLAVGRSLDLVAGKWPVGAVLAECSFAALHLAAGIGLLRQRRSVSLQTGPAIDAAIGGTALTLATWFLVARPLMAHAMSLASGLALLYLLATLVLSACWTYALLTRLSWRSASVRLVLVAHLCVALADCVRWVSAMDRPGPADQPAALLVAGCGFVVAARLHPRWREVGYRPSRSAAIDITRLLGLGAACLVSPLVALVWATNRRWTDHVAIALGSLVTIVLLIARLVGVLKEHEAGRRREEALSAGLSGLLVATDRTTIQLAAVLAARNLLRDPAAPVRMLPGLQLPAARVGCAWHLFAPGLLRPVALAGALPDHPGRPWLVAVSTPSEAGGGWMVVASSERPADPVLEALVTLGAQFGLARDRAELADDLQRRRSERRLASLIRHASDVIVIVDEAMIVRYESGSIAAVLGLGPDDLVGSTFRGLVHPDDAPTAEAQLGRLAGSERRSNTRLECRLRHRGGDWIDTEITATNLLGDADVGGLVLNIRDVSERKVLEAQLMQQAFHDPLTGLANRALLTDRVSHALARRARGGPVPSVLFIDLDDFKMVNDSLGHPAGDRLLIEVADRISGVLRQVDTAARLGGDEFGVLVEGTSEGSGLEAGRRILAALERPVVIDGTEIIPRASIGTARGDNAITAAELLRNADLAMYTAKADGVGVAEFKPQMHDSARRRLEVQGELSRALERGEFELHYQPIVDIGAADFATSMAETPVVGVEALVRWNHPTHGRVPPLEFVPVAEETGLIVPLGRWILEEACRTVAGWAAEGLVSHLSLTVNVSARQLQEPTLVDDVALAVSASGLDPAWLVAEITESVVMRDTMATVGWLKDLKRLGVRIAIDDFGTGYSSLAYLQRFPIDVMKIDRSFVVGLGEDPTATELVRAVLTLSDSLGMTTLAEGIETPAQLAELRRLGCRLGQGFAFARPMSGADLAAALRSGALRVAHHTALPVPVSPLGD